MNEDKGHSFLCGTAFWEWSFFWEASYPRLPYCFRQSLLVWVPCAWLWGAALCRGVWCKFMPDVQKSGPSPWTLLTITKIALSACLLLCCAVDGVQHLFYDRTPARKTEPVDLISVSVRMITFMLSLWLLLKQKREGHLNSFALAIFWALLSFCTFFVSPVYDLLTVIPDEHIDPVLFVSGTISFFLIVAQACFSFFSDPQYSYLYKQGRDEYLREHQPLLSRLLFSWINRLVCYGYRHTLTVEDLDPFNPNLATAIVHQKFYDQWSKEEKRHLNRQNDRTCRRGPSLALAIWRALWPWLLLAGTLELLYVFLSLTPPILLDLLLGFVGSDSEPAWHGYLYAGLMFVVATSCTLLYQHSLDSLIIGSLLPKSGLSAQIYRKVLRLSGGSRRRYTLGELCNLLSVDAQRVFELVWALNSLWSQPLRIALTLALLWRYLGAACLAGGAVLVLLMPISGWIAGKTQALQKTQMEYKDSRLRQMNEILNGIKVLKLFAWEYPYMSRIGEIRQKEAVTLRKLAFLNGTIVFLWIFAPFLIAVSSFVTFLLMDDRNVLNPSVAFVSLTLFNKLRSSMAAVPQVIAEVVQSRIAFRRITEFLLSEELKPDAVDGETTLGNAVELDGASLSWSRGEEPFLRDVTMSVPQGSLVALVGRVGTGKSALFSAILGEMHAEKGVVRVNKRCRLAYVSQQAWIQNDTLRQNVLFVKPPDQKRYDDAIYRCCLKQDIKALPAGDLTEIGEKGVNLSGGQKQRVSLARAVYQDADVYLLDDPLSAVDAQVGQHIFRHVIGPKGVLQNKTRILSTHDLSILPDCDRIFLMSGGRILEAGTYAELLERKGEFATLIEEYKNDQAEEAEDISVDNEEDLKSQMFRAGHRQLSRTMSRQLSHQDEIKDTARKARLIDKEKMEIGRVKASVFWTYFRNATRLLTFLTLLGFAAYQSFEVGASVWLSEWSSDSPLPDGSQDIPQRNWRIVIYAVLGLGQGLSSLLAALVLALGSTRASIRFHRSMLWSVLRSPMSFFDTTPVGRILNRFGKDMHMVDIRVPSCLSNVMTVVVAVLGAVAVICANHPIFLLILVPLGALYIGMQLFYMASSRQVRRLISVTLSPVLSHFSESAQGASTVRAFGAQFRFVGDQNKLLDTSCRVFVNSSLLNRWLTIRLQLIGATIVLITALLAVAQREHSSAAIVGLTLSYAINVTDILATMVRHLTQLENSMVSVERINEYSGLPAEASWETECCLSLRDWPQEGAVTFKGYKMRYRSNTELILKGVTVHIEGGQKVGLVGRTGAGKSSLALALFRIVEPDEGSLYIDGVDASLLGLHELRDKITVIPQDPILFSGNLRLNLDPLDKHSDQELWAAIEHAHLKDFVTGISGGLDYPVDEGGQNLSVGQRQQVCLARALLKKSRILVLDEATAAVDMQTDRLIQASIRQEFADCTVITIAHRLYTVLDYDRILVMEDGKIAEDGPPDELLQKPESLFRELGKAAGLI